MNKDRHVEKQETPLTLKPQFQKFAKAYRSVRTTEKGSEVRRLEKQLGPAERVFLLFLLSLAD